MFRAAKFFDPNTRLVLSFMALAVVLPAGALFWFMNAAARSQAEAARRSVGEAYHAQLRLLRERIDVDWQARLAATARAAGDGGASHFPAALEAAGADAILFLDASGNPAYPSPVSISHTAPPTFVPMLRLAQTLERRPDQSVAMAAYRQWISRANNPAEIATAAQGLVRCQVRDGRGEAALAEILKYFTTSQAEKTVDFDGHSIAADEQLLALHLMQPTGRGFQRAARHLAGLLGDYRIPIPSAQRVFLADELRTLAPGLPLPPTVDAEQLSLLYLSAEKPRPGSSGMQASALLDVWKLTTPDRRVVAIYRTATHGRGWGACWLPRTPAA